jgi:quinol monooxygenase YgiN
MIEWDLSLRKSSAPNGKMTKRSSGKNSPFIKGGKKMIRVHIKRKILEDKKEDLNDLIKELRAMTMGQPGYITGETLRRVDKPGESLVVSKWQSIESWNRWFQNRERSKIQEKIDQLLGEETKYEIYEFD